LKNSKAAAGFDADLRNSLSSARTSDNGRAFRRMLQGWQLPRRFCRMYFKSGRWLTGMMWSAVVDRQVQHDSRNRHTGSSRITCKRNFCQR
jgi:hypothetical protein